MCLFVCLLPGWCFLHVLPNKGGVGHPHQGVGKWNDREEMLRGDGPWHTVRPLPYDVRQSQLPTCCQGQLTQQGLLGKSGRQREGLYLFHSEKISLKILLYSVTSQHGLSDLSPVGLLSSDTLFGSTVICQSLKIPAAVWTFKRYLKSFFQTDLILTVFSQFVNFCCFILLLLTDDRALYDSSLHKGATDGLITYWYSYYYHVWSSSVVVHKRIQLQFPFFFCHFFLLNYCADVYFY